MVDVGAVDVTLDAVTVLIGSYEVHKALAEVPQSSKAMTPTATGAQVPVRSATSELAAWEALMVDLTVAVVELEVVEVVVVATTGEARAKPGAVARRGSNKRIVDRCKG